MNSCQEENSQRKNAKFQPHQYIYFIVTEIESADPETEVALNLICVDESTRKPIDIPIRPKPVKDLLNDVNQLKKISHEPIQSDADAKTKLDSKDFLDTKPGENLQHMFVFFSFGIM